jgi:DNA-binding MarR family transcriptional regulator
MTVVRKTIAGEPWRDPALGPCACSQLRRTSRAVSTLYDDFLSASGLTVTQYSLLVTIARANPISRTSLAARLGMERTTLTRNLRPLEREGLIAEKPGSDRRERVLQLTPNGRKRLDRSFPLWEKAQKAFFAAFGPDRFEELRSLLEAAAEASRTAGVSVRTRTTQSKRPVSTP